MSEGVPQLIRVPTDTGRVIRKQFIAIGKTIALPPQTFPWRYKMAVVRWLNDQPITPVATGDPLAPNITDALVLANTLLPTNQTIW